MDRRTVYQGELPYQLDFLYGQRYSFEAFGLLAMDFLGSSTLVSGCACTPTGPASLQVKVAPGRIYSLQNLEGSDWGIANLVGGLPADSNSDHQVLKQGLLRDTATLSGFAAPGTGGQSINYLVQAQFSESDTDNTVLPFFNAAAPDVPWAGPGNSGGVLPTNRRNTLSLSVKAGTAATTGTQTTPAPDAGKVGLHVVTVGNGQTTITSGNISTYGSAPFITETLVQKISQAFADARYMQAAVMSFGQCRLSVVSTTSLKLSPFQGSLLTINGSHQAIPGGGVTIANTGLVASTLYYVYAFMNSGTMTLELSATGHSTGANGVEIKTGDATRSLVGMIYTNGSTPGQFIDSGTQKFCANWFNRRLRIARNSGTGSLGSAATTTDLAPADHAQILSWADEVGATMSGNLTSPTLGGLIDMGVAVDATGNNIQTGINVYVAGYNINFSVAEYAITVAEGLHYSTAVGSTDTGVTASFSQLIYAISANI
jgi:hypothetical protein